MYLSDPSATTTQSTPTLATTDPATTTQTITTTQSATSQQPPATTTASSMSPTSSTNGQINATTGDNIPTNTSTPEQDMPTSGPIVTVPDTTPEDGSGIKTTTGSETFTDESNLEQEGMNQLPVILGIAVAVAFIAGIVVVGSFLIVGRWVCKRMHKQRRLNLNSLSIASPLGMFELKVYTELVSSCLIQLIVLCVIGSQ